MPYQFISTGGCPICDAMAGVYDSMPNRPHPNCDCNIQAVRIKTDTDCYFIEIDEATDIEYDQNLGTEENFIVHVRYLITCLQEPKKELKWSHSTVITERYQDIWGAHLFIDQVIAESFDAAIAVAKDLCECPD